jgi:alkaline phosphatase D
VAALPACDPAPIAPSARFAWGVASGDPTPRAVIVWTRLAVERDTTVRCDVFRDVAERELVTSASASAVAARDGCVKLDVVGLEPATTYYFRFVTEDGDASPLGRTRTLPEGEVARMRAWRS